MNLSDLMSEMWNFTQFQQASQQQDWRRQQFMDRINETIYEMSSVVPDQLALKRQFSMTIVVGTSVYPMNDWVIRGCEFFTKDNAAHKVRFRRQRNADRNNLRNPFLSNSALGPWDMTGYEMTTSAYRSGAAGASTGATAVRLSQTATMAGVTFDGTEVGRMLKLNGEGADYKVVSASGSSVAVDRPIYTRLPTTGTGVTGIGPASYSNVRWEIGPKTRCQIELLPPPSSTPSNPLYYRALVRPRKLLWLDDEPEIPEDYHPLIYKGAIAQLGLAYGDSKTYQMYKDEYDQQMMRWREEDRGDQDSEDSVNLESPTNGGMSSHWPNDMYPPHGWQ